MSAYLQEHGLTSPETGEIRRMLSEWRQTLALQLKYAEALGLTPASRFGLGADVGNGRYMDLAAQVAAELPPSFETALPLRVARPATKSPSD